jgi:hypothetical protein
MFKSLCISLLSVVAFAQVIDCAMSWTERKCNQIDQKSRKKWFLLKKLLKTANGKKTVVIINIHIAKKYNCCSKKMLYIDGAFFSLSLYLL